MGLVAGPGTAEGQRGTPWGAVLGFLLGVVGLAAGVTLVFLGMRAVMDVGGACATGGPYVPAVECPEGVPAATLLGVAGTVIATFMLAFFGSRIGGRYAAAWLLVWPALFLSTGWNFLEYGLDAPGEGGVEWGWLTCAVIFLVIGGVPLALAILWRDDLSSTAVQYRLQSVGRSRARGRVPDGSHMILQVPGMDDVDLGPAPDLGPSPDLGPDIHLGPPSDVVPPSAPGLVLGAGVHLAEEADARTAAAPPRLVDELERLAALRERGELTTDEYAAAKRALLGEVDR